jgi:hypothetical protein
VIAGEEETVLKEQDAVTLSPYWTAHWKTLAAPGRHRGPHIDGWDRPYIATLAASRPARVKAVAIIAHRSLLLRLEGDLAGLRFLAFGQGD